MIGDRISPLPARRRAPAASVGLAALAGVVAVVAGREVANGRGTVVALAVTTAAFVVWTLVRPEHAALAIIAVVPFMVYPVTVGGLSVFAAAPLVGMVAIALLFAQHRSTERLRWRLSIPAFAALLIIALVATLHSSSVSTAGSRIVYLALFGLFAWALAASITGRRLTTRTVAIAIVVGSAAGAIALLVQVVAQFVVDQHQVTTWLAGEAHLFAGQKAGDIAQQQQNWHIDSLNIVRGIFPFMSAPSAGQYMMLGLIAAVWVWRTRPSQLSPGGRTLLLVAMVLIGAALLVTFSRQSWLGALVGIAALTLRRDPLRPVLVVALLFVVLAVTPIPGGHTTFGDYLLTASDTTSVSTGTRLGLLDQAIHLVPKHALIGVGPGLYGTLNPDPQNPVYYAHNVWLDEIVELGVAGGLALIAVFVLAMRSAFRRRAMLGFSLLAAFAVANLFDDVLYFPRNGILLAVAFALAAAGDGLRRQQPQGSTRSA